MNSKPQDEEMMDLTKGGENEIDRSLEVEPANNKQIASENSFVKKNLDYFATDNDAKSSSNMQDALTKPTLDEIPIRNQQAVKIYNQIFTNLISKKRKV